MSAYKWLLNRNLTFKIHSSRVHFYLFIYYIWMVIINSTIAFIYYIWMVIINSTIAQVLERRCDDYGKQKLVASNPRWICFFLYI